MSTQDALPRWLRTTFIAVSDAPMTNFRILNTEILSYLTAGFLFAAALMQVKIEEGIWWAWLGYLAAKGGWAMGAAWAKRATYIPSPPATQDIEDTAATTPTPAVLTKTDAQKAAELLEASQKLTRGEQG